MSYQPGQPGNLSNLPNSSSWGLPTSFDFSKNGMPAGVMVIALAVVIALIAVHLLKIKL